MRPVVTPARQERQETDPQQDSLSEAKSAGGGSPDTSTLRPAPVPAAPTRDAIATRAYALFLKRGGAHGHDRADWLQAEAELQAEAQARIDGVWTAPKLGSA